MGERRTRAELDGPSQLAITTREVGRREHDIHYCECDVCLGQVVIERNGFARQLFRLEPACRRGDVAKQSEGGGGVSQTSIGERIAAILFNRLLAIVNGGQ